MSPEAAKLLLSVFAAACIPAFGFAVNGAIGWHSGKEQGKLRFILGLTGVIIAAIICVFLYNKGFPAAEETGEPEAPGNSVTDSNPDVPVEKDSFVRGKSYEGGTYTGEIDLETKKPDGSGMMYYSDGSMYDGNWKNGLPDGDGEMTYQNGDTYNGQWKEGKREGYGTYVWCDDRQYIGYYKDDLRNGEGEYVGWTGFTKTYGWSGNYTGTSKDNYFEGEGRFVFDNGDQFEGVFRAGQFWDGTYTYNSGAQFQIVNGVPSA